MEKVTPKNYSASFPCEILLQRSPKFFSKEAQNSNIFEISSERFCPNGFRQAGHSGLWLLLRRIILSQTCSKLQKDSIEVSEVDNRLEKNKFC